MGDRYGVVAPTSLGEELFGGVLVRAKCLAGSFLLGWLGNLQGDPLYGASAGGGAKRASGLVWRSVQHPISR